jgi:hypothetical protein
MKVTENSKLNAMLTKLDSSGFDLTNHPLYVCQIGLRHGSQFDALSTGLEFADKIKSGTATIASIGDSLDPESYMVFDGNPSEVMEKQSKSVEASFDEDDVESFVDRHEEDEDGEGGIDEATLDDFMDGANVKQDGLFIIEKYMEEYGEDKVGPDGVRELLGDIESDYENYVQPAIREIKEFINDVENFEPGEPEVTSSTELKVSEEFPILLYRDNEPFKLFEDYADYEAYESKIDTGEHRWSVEYFGEELMEDI